MLIAVIEDHRHEQEHLVGILRRDHYDVLTFSDGLSALDYFRYRRADVTLIDHHLPGGPNGIAVARQLRQMHPADVLIMTTSSADVDLVIEAMQIGVDDYIIKPLRAEAVLKRISEAVIRRQEWFPKLTPPSADGPLEINIETHRVRWYGQDITLTPTEFNLLHRLVGRPGHVFTYAELYALHHGERVDPALARDRLKTHLANLKDKLEVGGRPEVLQKVRGVGMKWIAPLE